MIESLWDNFGRMRSIIYNNGDTVAYGYDAGGLVNGVTGIKDGASVTYVDSIVYDKFGQRLDVKYNNGTGTRYAYNTDDRRLNRLITYDTSNGTKIQDLQYRYDMVGNITNLDNYMAKNMDGADPENLTRGFIYDGFYRLINAGGELHNVADSANPKRMRDFDVTTEFDSIHNITSKNQSVNIYDPTGAATPYVAKTYDNTYDYNTTVSGNFKPHAPSSIGNKSFTYDKNGNQKGYTIDTETDDFERVITWDDADRITRVTDRNTTQNTVLTDQQNWYNDAGQRVIKKEGTVETDYVNQFTSVRSDTVNLVKVTTNNIFVGNERVISSMDTVNDGTAGDNFMYFYHTDHLGSTGYLTDKNGNLREHMEYTPWGETWLEQVNEELMWNETVHLPNYMFTSKELDATGLYYFGARYYDPQTSVWQSADQALIKYKITRLYTPENLSVYSYSINNPIGYIDPDGNDWFKVKNKWEWHKGSIYISPEGTKYDKGYRYFVKFEQFMNADKTAGGGTQGKVTLYDQNKEIAHDDTFSGGVIVNGKSSDPTLEANYWLRPDIPRDKSGLKPNDELQPSYNLQTGLRDYIIGGIRIFAGGEWGNTRIRMNFDKTDPRLPDNDIFGFYFHGKDFDKFVTHGCTATKGEDVFNKLIDIHVPVPASVIRQ